MAQRRNVVISVLTRAAISLAVLAAGVFLFYALFLARPEPPSPQDIQILREVRTLQPRLLSVHRQWTGFGAARAMDRADVPAQVNAIVVEVPESVKPGAPVALGDIIARLDALDFEQQLDLIIQQLNAIDAQIEQLDIEEASWGERLELARSEEAVARQDVERFRGLLASGDATELELQRAEAALSAAQRAVSTIREEFEKAAPRRLRLRAERQGLEVQRQIAQRNIDRAVITSPLAGTIESVLVEDGEQVAPGQPVAHVISLQRMEVPVRLPSSARLHVRIGDDAVIIPAGVPDRQWQGQVVRIGPRDDEATRTFPVFIEVVQDPAAPGPLTPGLFVQATIESSIALERMLVPRQALSRGSVLLIEDGRIVPHEVNVEFYLSGEFPLLGAPDVIDWAALAQPLPDGAVVIINGSTDMPPGARVRSANPGGGGLP